jgi:hypothetical protein
MPDLVLDYHRLKMPIDHPDLSVTRTKLEYPTVDVKLIYLAMMDKAVPYGSDGTPHANYYATTDSFTDLAVELWSLRVNDDLYRKLGPVVRLQNAINLYQLGLTSSYLGLIKRVNDTDTAIATYSLSTSPDTPRQLKLSVSGSTLKGFQADMTTAKITATDTTFASGKFGCKMPSSSNYYVSDGAWGFASATLRSPSSPAPQAIAIIETGVRGSGRVEDPFRPLFSENFMEISSELNVPDFLLIEKNRYNLLRAKGFTDDEIRLLLNYIPQHQIDVDSVSYGTFEFSEKSLTNIIMIYGDNPYKAGAVQRQMDYAKSKNLRAFPPPKSYDDAVALYNQLKKDYPHWIAGVHNWCYQIFGYEIFDLLQNIDFYHGELLDHMTHYNQLKQVPDWEITNRLNELIDKLSRETVLTDERDKHIAKAREVLKKGW